MVMRDRAVFFLEKPSLGKNDQQLLKLTQKQGF